MPTLSNTTYSERASKREWQTDRDEAAVGYKMNEAGSGQPDAEEDGDELHESDAVAGP